MKTRVCSKCGKLRWTGNIESKICLPCRRERPVKKLRPLRIKKVAVPKKDKKGSGKKKGKKEAR